MENLFLVVFFHLMLAGRQPFGFWGGFSCFVSFIWSLSAVCFSDWSGMPFFVCHQHLWFTLSFFATGICVRSLSFMAFSAAGIRVRLFVCLVSARFSQGISVLLSFWYCAVRLLLVSFILGDSNWIFLQVGYPVDSTYKFRFEANPIWYSAIKFTKSRTQRSARYTNGRDWGAA